MTEVYLIRHGATAGNLLRRYIGRTDEPLSDAGRAALQKKRYPRPDILFTSPMRRCRESAEILFPGLTATVVPDMRECDFGDFENKNYRELAGNADYAAWVESGGTLPFPGGEDVGAFQRRSALAYRAVLAEILRPADGGAAVAALVLHNGTVMSVMQALFPSEGDYFSWGIPGGGAYVLSYRGTELVGYRKEC